VPGVAHPSTELCHGHRPQLGDIATRETVTCHRRFYKLGAVLASGGQTRGQPPSRGELDFIMESFDQWTHRLRDMSDGAGVTSHLFLEQLGSKSGPKAQKLIIEWAKQDYFVSRRFPCLLGTIIGQIDDPKIRHIMVKNLWEEHGEGRRNATHHALFCKLMSDIGIDLDLTLLAMTQATRRFIEIQETLARENVLLGLGAFCYANEYITVDEFAPLEKAVEYEFPGADLSFFIANRQVDARHAAESEDVIASLVSSDSDLSLVEQGATAALEARVSFYDDLL
jgi:pyrroloquinoline-quinone synthase